MRAKAPLGSLPLAAAAAIGIGCGGHAQPQFDVPPVLANREEITEAMRSVGAGLEARVVLFVHVDEKGHVSNVRIAQSSGSEQLDDAARWIGQRMLFEPARSEGRPVAAAVQVPVTFDVVVPSTRDPVLRNADKITRRMAQDFPDLEGEIRMRVYVGGDGWVLDVREGRSSEPGLAPAARKLVQLMNFQPAYRGDAVIATWVNVRFQFAGDRSRVRVEGPDD